MVFHNWCCFHFRIRLANTTKETDSLVIILSCYFEWLVSLDQSVFIRNMAMWKGRSKKFIDNIISIHREGKGYRKIADTLCAFRTTFGNIISKWYWCNIPWLGKKEVVYNNWSVINCQRTTEEFSYQCERPTERYGQHEYPGSCPHNKAWTAHVVGSVHKRRDISPC